MEFKSKEEILRNDAEEMYHVCAIWNESDVEQYKYKCSKCKINVAMSDKELLKKNSIIICPNCALEDLKKRKEVGENVDVVVWDKNKEIALDAMALTELRRIERLAGTLAG